MEKKSLHQSLIYTFTLYGILLFKTASNN